MAAVDWLRDFLSGWTLASVLGVLGFALSVFLAMRQRPDVFAQVSVAREFANGAWQPYALKFVVVNTGGIPVAIFGVGTRPNGDETFAQLPSGAVTLTTASGRRQPVTCPETPTRLDINDVLTWDVPLDWFRPGWREGAEPIVSYYARRAWWRRKNKRIREWVGKPFMAGLFLPVAAKTADDYPDEEDE